MRLNSTRAADLRQFDRETLIHVICRHEEFMRMVARLHTTVEARIDHADDEDASAAMDNLIHIARERLRSDGAEL